MFSSEVLQPIGAGFLGQVEPLIEEARECWPRFRIDFHHVAADGTATVHHTRDKSQKGHIRSVRAVYRSSILPEPIRRRLRWRETRISASAWPMPMAEAREQGNEGNAELSQAVE